MTDAGAPSLDGWYRRYNELCNQHRFGELRDFVHSDVRVNGEVQGLAEYVAGLQAVVSAFPDYRWDIQHLLVDGDWIAAHFLDSGRHSGPFLGVAATGREVRAQEFSFYRVADGLIVEVWVAADNLSVLEQIRG